KIAISAGSACTTQNVEPSHVLLSLGLSEDQSHYAIRIGCGRFNTDEDIETAIEQISDVLKLLKNIRD
ncbi:MAG: IscS subfamily cysteine desulfurase, partial [Candidatus Nitrosopelagicus sp.]|nr:IscS subfamily cysteine desulfurase [Candidatus Nitrosopelagicus sp.]